MQTEHAIYRMRPENMCTLKYTNESVEAIAKALTPIGYGESAIAVCGCGAQPLALLEHVSGNGIVLAVDHDYCQLAFARHAAALIRRGNVKRLKRLKLAPKEPGYFTDDERFERLRENLGRLEFRFMDISKPPSTEEREQLCGFSRGYFSNVLVNPKFMRDLADSAIVYIAANSPYIPFNIDQFFGGVVPWNYITPDQSDTCNYWARIRKHYRVDIRRTKLACEIEKRNTERQREELKCVWTPTVFRKKAENRALGTISAS